MRITLFDLVGVPQNAASINELNGIFLMKTPVERNSCWRKVLRLVIGVAVVAQAAGQQANNSVPRIIPG